jgi:hypothetical protein
VSLRPPGKDQDDATWHKIITYATALDYNLRFQFAQTSRRLSTQLLCARDDPSVALKIESNFEMRFRYRMDVSNLLNHFLQGAIGLRNHVEKVRSTRNKDLSHCEEVVSKRLGRAFQAHTSDGPVALVYSLSNVFRHELVPDTINTGLHYVAPGQPGAGFEFVTSLAMGGLIGGKGWNKTSEKYAALHNPVELISLAEAYLTSVTILVETIVAEVRGEAQRR